MQSNDLEVLKKACASGRMVSVTYGRSPTKRYGGQHIDHMVNICHGTDSWFAVLDNNYVAKPGGEDNTYEWMTPAEFARAYKDGSSAGWAVILLGAPPPPRPYSKPPAPLPPREGDPCSA